MKRLWLLLWLAYPQLAAAQTFVQPDDWVKIGHTFGPSDNWQFGLDKSLTAGACGAYAIRSKLYLGGPCRDVLLLTKDQVRVFHLGMARLGGLWAGRAGVDVGNFVAAGASYAVNRLPYLESLEGWTLPSWAQYIGKVSKVDYMVLYDGGRFDHGPTLKLDIPLADLLDLLPRTAARE